MRPQPPPPPPTSTSQSPITSMPPTSSTSTDDVSSSKLRDTTKIIHKEILAENRNAQTFPLQPQQQQQQQQQQLSDNLVKNNKKKKQKCIKRSETYSDDDSCHENNHLSETCENSVCSGDNNQVNSSKSIGSCNKYLKLKRVASDNSNISLLENNNYNHQSHSFSNSNLNSINKLKRVEINVSDTVKKPLKLHEIIVKRFDQLGENLPLITDPKNTIYVKNRDASIIFTKKIDNTVYPKVHRRVRKNTNCRRLEEDKEQRRSLQWPVFRSSGDFLEGAEEKGALLRHSWYAPGYDILEEDFEQDGKDSSIVHNLAGVRNHLSNGTLESASLLDQQQIIHPTRGRRSVVCVPSSQQSLSEGPHALSLGGPVPRKRRFEQFLKSLVGRRPSKEPTNPPPLLPSPEIKISKSPSEHNIVELTKNNRLNISTTSLTSVHQKLWSVVPLLKKDVSCSSLTPTKSMPLATNSLGLRKCETVLALTQSTNNLEPIKPLNRLRNCASVATCSRCSSLLSLAAAGSRYSLNLSNGGFVPVNSSSNHINHGSMHRLTTTSTSSSSSSSSTSSTGSKAPMMLSPNVATTILATQQKFTCKLCLGEHTAENLTRILQCGCSFCTECMTAYVEFEISEGAYEVSCPDAMCSAQGIISITEITSLAANSLVEKHHRYRLNREVELDKFRTWCPKAGCETICLVGQTPTSSDKIVQLPPSASTLPSPCAVHCPTCREDFCSGCKKAWHPTMSCEENTKRLAADGQTESLGIPFDNDLIKCCPMCAVPIEKDEGCAQMMCKRCKHVFCWYCLASLDDDFLLRHYDKGPCKNKLGHSRASVVWHRAQVIGIFAGFGILLLVASPLLLLAAPCIVCCKCRICSGAAKLEETEVEYDDAIVALQR